jgi:1-acyl-sn-glycerol-3-phosphate acyltransferase
MAHELPFLVGSFDRSLERALEHEPLWPAALDALVAQMFIATTRIVTAARARWVGCEPTDRVRIYFVNHASHLDFMLLWTVLPAELRRHTRPVAARDYWEKGRVRRYLAERVFRCVFVDREQGHCVSPIMPLLDAIDDGESLILFPEGTRGTGEALQEFRAGIFHLAQERPDVELIPVWMDNNYRVLPKGSFVPLPLLCTATFGAPARLAPGEQKPAFLQRLRQQLADVRSL